MKNTDGGRKLTPQLEQEHPSQEPEQEQVEQLLWHLLDLLHIAGFHLLVLRGPRQDVVPSPQNHQVKCLPGSHCEMIQMVVSRRRRTEFVVFVAVILKLSYWLLLI
ncbi:hypothetical protein J3458_019114 [Metarhizium acridum]|uniref:uncharacterized protein n=1 Tax=Metarhizium acridum TaxID=92637 RepID=UPI001C6BE260|nr:hypothetical protein J3458_019114 [Metarhizium acridum]